MRAISFGFHDLVGECDADHIADAGHDPSYAVERGKFRHHMAAVGMRAGADAVRAVGSVELHAAPTPVFLTFDDGTLGAYAYAAEDLDTLGWPGHFFVATDWIGKPGFLDRRQIRDLYRRGHVVGSHSCSHPDWMSRLSWGELTDEWSRSCAVLGDIVGLPVTTASIAGGDYSRKVGLAAAACGIRALFTSEPTTRVSVVDGCLILGRYSVTRSTPASTVGAIAGRAMWPRLQQAVLWSAKKAAKRLAGRSYDGLRACVLGRLPQP